MKWKKYNKKTTDTEIGIEEQSFVLILCCLAVKLENNKFSVFYID